MVMISIILEILYMDKLAPMYKTIIPSAFRLPETIPITYNLMLKIIISYNIFLIIKISQIMVYMSFGFPVMVTTPISPILPSIHHYCYLTSLPIQPLFHITNHQVKPLQHICVRPWIWNFKLLFFLGGDVSYFSSDILNMQKCC